MQGMEIIRYLHRFIGWRRLVIPSKLRRYGILRDKLRITWMEWIEVSERSTIIPSIHYRSVRTYKIKSSTQMLACQIGIVT